MDLKELCKKVDRIAILERCELDNKRFTNKQCSQSESKTRYAFYFITIYYYKTLYSNLSCS